MHSNVRHAVASAALVASFALGAALPGTTTGAAAPQQGSTPIERLNNLEKQVATLVDQVAKLEGSESKPAPTSTSPAKSDDVSPKVAALEKQLAGIVQYLTAQAESAKRLATVLDDSRAKGFTYGINPDSRTVLLAGFEEFVTTLQSNVPAGERDGRVARPTRGR